MARWRADPKETEMSILIVAALAAFAFIVLWPRAASAHCDTEDGPAVAAGRVALETGEVGAALAWVHEAGEAEVRESFDRALRVRSLGGEARVVADRLFLETLVRVHRAGEGAGFDGIKPAGTIDHVVAAADHAIEMGTVAPLAGLVSADRLPELQARLEDALAVRAHDIRDVGAGRRWVAAYVRFVKLAEGEEHEHGPEARHGDAHAGAGGCGHHADATEADHGAAGEPAHVIALGAAHGAHAG